MNKGVSMNDKQIAPPLDAGECPQVVIARLQAENARLRQQVDGLEQQHHRDSAELRRLCAERDNYRQQVEAIFRVQRHVKEAAMEMGWRAEMDDDVLDYLIGRARLAAQPAAVEPVAWGVFYFGGQHSGKLYTHCATKLQAEVYISDRHQSDDSNTFRAAPLYTAPPAQARPTSEVVDSLQAIANVVCEKIPEMCVLSVHMERGAAWVELDDGKVPLPDMVDDSLIVQVYEALSTALEQIATPQPVTQEKPL